MEDIRTRALRFHSEGRKGKTEMALTKPCSNQEELSLAYTPGVAEPCREIVKDSSASYEYTNRGNLVAVVSDGSAVLGLGNIGAGASKPVMEGKGVLFKRFAGVDVFDIELNVSSPDELIDTVESMEPTFGGINLEDINSPNCFYIERELKSRMNIPVFHDDQHGTAIISGAALINGALIQDKRIEDLKVVFSGAGPSAIACAEHYVILGVKRENIILTDSKGVLYKGRKEGLNEYKRKFLSNTEARTLADALEGADVFAGLSRGGIVTQAMLKRMATKPLVFAMANPDPEIGYEEARSSRPDCVMATGRSDFPNQVNNVLGFPFIFRGALDVRASDINADMKVAATKALAGLARNENPSASVCAAYGVKSLEFGADYLIPKPLDLRVLVEESAAVAEAAVKTGAAGIQPDMSTYRTNLEEMADRLAIV